MVGYKYEENFDRLAENGTLKVQRAPKEVLNFRKLLNKRMDLFVCDIDVGFQTMATSLSKEDRQLITYHPKPLDSRYAYLLFSKQQSNNLLFLDAFNKGLKTLKQNGKYDEYLQKSREGGYLLP